MSKILWTKGIPMFPRIGTMTEQEKNGYIGELEAQLRSATDRLVRTRACLGDIEHTEVDLSSMAPPKEPKRHPQKGEVLDLLNMLVEHGCKLTQVDDGGESTEGSLTELLDAILSVGDSTLYVITPDDQPKWLYLILGNEAGVVINDYSPHPVLDKVERLYSERWGDAL